MISKICEIWQVYENMMNNFVTVEKSELALWLQSAFKASTAQKYQILALKTKPLSSTTVQA